MTMQDLKDISMMLAIVSAVSEGEVYKHLHAKKRNDKAYVCISPCNVQHMFRLVAQRFKF